MTYIVRKPKTSTHCVTRDFKDDHRPNDVVCGWVVQLWKRIKDRIKKEFLKNPVTVFLTLFVAVFMVFTWFYPNKDCLFQTPGIKTVTTVVTFVTMISQSTHTSTYTTLMKEAVLPGLGLVTVIVTVTIIVTLFLIGSARHGKLR